MTFIIPFLLDIEEKIESDFTKLSIERAHVEHESCKIEAQMEQENDESRITDLHEKKKILESIVSELSLKLEQDARNNNEAKLVMDEIEELEEQCEIVRRRLQQPVQVDKMSESDILKKNLKFLENIDLRSGKIHDFAEVLRQLAGNMESEKHLMVQRVTCLLRVVHGPSVANEFSDLWLKGIQSQNEVLRRYNLLK